MRARRAATPIVLALGLAALLPARAEAHLVVTGMGPLYDGFVHFGLSPEDFLPVIALGLYAGLRGAAWSRAGLSFLTVGWIVGGACAMAGFAPPPLGLGIATCALFLLIGGTLALNRELRPAFCGALGAGLGLARGLADVAGATASFAHALTLCGMAAAVFTLFCLAASVTLPMRRLWMIVAARVGGSWLAALGLLLAGWLVRYGAAIQ